MLKKLNNKGMTLVEVVVCFALVTIVLVSMYNTISVYKTKQNIESYKETVTTYKNLLTKEIQDDLITKGLISANISDTAPTNEIYTVTMNFKDGSSKELIITRKKANVDYEGVYNNSFIYYGDMNQNGVLEFDDSDGNGFYDGGADFVLMNDCAGDLSTCNENQKKIMGDNLSRSSWGINQYGRTYDKCIEVELVDADCTETAGESLYLIENGLIPKSVDVTETETVTQSDEFNIKYGDTEYPFPDLGSTEVDGHTLYDLKINNVYLSTDNNILSIYIGFYHPELLTRYAIDIVCPINYS